MTVRFFKHSINNMDFFINKYSLPMRFLITTLGGFLGISLLWFLFHQKEVPQKDVPQGTSLFGEINFETNPLTIPWKK